MLGNFLKNAFSISINQRFWSGGGLPGIFEWLLNKNRSQSWITLLARQTFETQNKFYSAVFNLMQAPLLAPTYYILSGPDFLEV